MKCYFKYYARIIRLQASTEITVKTPDGRASGYVDFNKTSTRHFVKPNKIKKMHNSRCMIHIFI